jgi:hypothetical protein
LHFTYKFVFASTTTWNLSRKLGMARPVSKLKEGATLDGLTHWALWNHVRFHQPLKVGFFENLASSYITRLLL